MGFPVDVRNKLLDNVFKGVQWDTTGAGVGFGNLNARVSKTALADDGTGYTASTGSVSFNGSTNWTSASGSSASLATGGGTIISTAAAAQGTLAALVIFEGTSGTSTVRAFYNFPVARTHYSGDSFTLGSSRLTFSLN